MSALDIGGADPNGAMEDSLGCSEAEPQENRISTSALKAAAELA